VNKYSQSLSADKGSNASNSKVLLPFSEGDPKHFARKVGDGGLISSLVFRYESSRENLDSRYCGVGFSARIELISHI
jgi:hypothetical protein